MGRLLLRGAELLDPEADAPGAGCLLVADGRIAARLPAEAPAPPDARCVDLAGLAVAPGLLDLHHHGRVIFSDAAALSRALAHDASVLVRHGTTGFLVTTVSLPSGELPELVGRLAELVADGPGGPAASQPLGIHLEGPWISPSAAGAHASGAVRGFERSEGEEIWDRAGGTIRMVTLAPELPGAAALLDRLGQLGIVASLGHSTASAEIVTQAVTQGARHVTHLFNAMGSLHHREPGLAGAALVEDRLSCDVICDGVHVDRRMLALAARAKRDRLLLITDRLDPPAAATAGPLASSRLRDDGTAFRLEDGRLAGSRLELGRALANARALAGMTRLEAVAACTLRPARVLGIEPERGTLRPGARADLVVLDPADRVVETWIGGERVYAADGPARA
jgi:N-acetylglucosamine-6-phosphate deacetylase